MELHGNTRRAGHVQLQAGGAGSAQRNELAGLTRRRKRLLGWRDGKRSDLFGNWALNGEVRCAASHGFVGICVEGRDGGSARSHTQLQTRSMS